MISVKYKIVKEDILGGMDAMINNNNDIWRLKSENKVGSPCGRLTSPHAATSAFCIGV